MSDSFRQRWSLPEEAFEERFQKAIYRVLAYIGDRIDVSRDDLRHLAFIARVPVDTYRYIGSVYSGNWRFDAEKYFLEAEQPHELAEKVENLLKSSILNNDQKEGVATIVSKESIGVRVSKDGRGRYITYPQGEPMLDEKVVEHTLLSIDGKSASEYTEALKAYSSGRWNDSSNKTLRALEEYLRQYLNNKAGLEANSKTIGKFLKESDVAEHFRNSIINHIKTLENHYNPGSKHNSNTQGAVEAEYLIYSVGVIVNTLEQLKISDKGA